MISKRTTISFIVILTLLLLNGCGRAEPTEPPPEDTAVPTATIIPDDAEPSITISPPKGDASQYRPITVEGRGFQPGDAINIQLGFPGDLTYWEEVYGQPTVQEDGTFVERIIIPTTWPDGNAVVEPEILIIAVAPDGVEATATFVNTAVVPTTAEPTPTMVEPIATTVPITAQPELTPTPTPLPTATPEPTVAPAETPTPVPTLVPTTPAPQAQATISTPGESRISITPLYGDLAAAPLEMTVEGTSFPGLAFVEVYVSIPDSDETMKIRDGIQTEDNGHFLVQFPMPTTWEDGRAITEPRLRITALTLKGNYYGFVTFINVPGAAPAPTATVTTELNPFVELVPGSGDVTAAPQQVTIKGSNFAPNETINIYLTVPGSEVRPTSYGETKVGADGEFELVITMPQKWEDGAPITEPELAIVAFSTPSQAYAWSVFRNR